MCRHHRLKRIKYEILLLALDRRDLVQFVTAHPGLSTAQSKFWQPKDRQVDQSLSVAPHERAMPTILRTSSHRHLRNMIQNPSEKDGVLRGVVRQMLNLVRRSLSPIIRLARSQAWAPKLTTQMPFGEE